MSASAEGTFTFLFTDVEGSTHLWEEFPKVMHQALEHHDRVFRELIATHGGQLVKTTGDGVHAAFNHAPSALQAALEAQLALQEKDWDEIGPLKVRMALHTGPAQPRDRDYYGSTVNRAARLMGIAHGGQIIVSVATRQQLAEAQPDDVQLQDLGAHQLKDLTEPEHVFQLCHPQLSNEFPALKSLGNLLGNLPRQRTRLIGRKRELEQVKQMLQDTRLLTLIGMGGTGKTRLSLQVAADLADAYPGGVWFVELASLERAELVPGAVARDMGVKEQADKSIQAALEERIGGQPLLLVLDNCEHLVEACAQLADALLGACGGLRILATSRERLNIAGEQDFPLAPLSVPEMNGTASDPSALLASDAVQLFVERAQAVRPLFRLSEGNAAAVAWICRQLDGIPLALELAAGRMKVLSAVKLAERLDDRFRLLKGGRRTALPRQQTLQALIDWSYDLLEQRERVLLGRLSVFCGGWSLEAAEAVCADKTIESFEVVDWLESLANKSLVEMKVDEEEARYRLLETVRQYAHQKLENAGQVKALRQRHAAHFLMLAEEAAQYFRGAEEVLWMARLEVEHDNLRASIQWALGTDKAEEALRLGVALGRFWYVHGHYAEGAGWLKQMLQRPAKASLRAMALHHAAVLTRFHEGTEAAKPFLEESLALFRELKDRKGEASALYTLGILAANIGDDEAAIALYEQAHTIYRELGDKYGITATLNGLGLVRYRQGNYEQAEALLEEGLTLCRDLNQSYLLATTLNNLGLVSYRQGDHQGAQAVHEESLLLRWELGDRRGLAVTFNSLAADVGAQGEPRRATQLLGAAQALLEEIGADLEPQEKALHQETAENARKALGEAGYREAFAKGQDLTLEQAIDLALQPPANEET